MIGNSGNRNRMLSDFGIMLAIAVTPELQVEFYTQKNKGRRAPPRPGSE